MRLTTQRFCLLCLTLTWMPLAAHAGVMLHVKGLDDPLKAAVVSSVQLSQYQDHDATAAQVRRLFEQAPEEARAALRPYGYFDAQVNGQIQQVGDDWVVTLQIDPGAPVRVTDVNIDVPAKAAALPAVQHAIESFKPTEGHILDQGEYTASRNAINTALTAAGYLDAEMTKHRVAVTLANHSAVVNLAWDTGTRYRFGTIDFEGSQFYPGFLQRYVPWQPGDYFDQGDLLALQQNLNSADYFSVVNVSPDYQHKHDGVVDVDVAVQPDERTVYTGGPFIGTDTGLGIQLGVKRRWVNNRGHTWESHLVLAQRLKTLTTFYSIPLPDHPEHAWNFGAKYRDADTETSHSRTLELIGNQTRRWHGWLLAEGVHVLSGTYTVGRRGDEPDDAPGIEHGSSTLVYPEITLAKKHADNLVFVRNGWLLTFGLRSTVGSVLSDTNFVQFVAHAKWIDAFAGDNRLILRADAGITHVDDFTELPPQLRFFGGGSRSNRGYGYQALGPRNAYGRVIGGKRLLMLGATVEHYFTPHWGMAAFVDAGNAFNGTDLDPAIGAGLGLRWLSPVGLIRLDLGTPINNDRHSGIQLNIVIGPDL